MEREEILQQIQTLASHVEMACVAAQEGDESALDRIETNIARLDGLAIDLQQAQPDRNHSG